MSYVVLARKYRPQLFDEVVGQNPVSQTLLNALESGRIAHAYVFSGPRGVGKTTTARLLAKCLNCEKGPTKTPCNTCVSCKSIMDTTSIDDVLEIDGASNRGIEQIRELRESAKYAPARSRYRIYIIDEAHQITKDAFGALLKTLEEPPPHVVFMMATTEVQKIPAPILSRCQRFSLRPITPDLVFAHLKKICEKEKIKVEEAALANIVRFVEGSLRDALSLLDQAVVFAPAGITSQTIRDLLGLLPSELIRDFTEKLRDGDPTALLQTINKLVLEGIDLTQLGKDLQNHFHTLLLAKAGVEDNFKLNVEQNKKDAALYGYDVLERNIRLLSAALDDMRSSETPRAVFEVYALKIAQKTLDPKALVERLEKLSAGMPASASAATPSPAPTRFTPPPAPSFSAKPAAFAKPLATPMPKAAAPVEPAAPEPETSISSSSSASDTDLTTAWPQAIEDVSAIKVALATALEGAKAVFDNNRVQLTFDKSFDHEMASRALETIKTCLEKRAGRPVSIELKIDKSAPAPAKTSVSRSIPAAPPPIQSKQDAEAFEEVTSDEVGSGVQNALKHFPGVIKREKKTPS